MRKRKKSRKKSSAVHNLTPEQEAVVSSLIASFPSTDRQQVISQLSSPLVARAFLEKLTPKDETVIEVVLAVSEAFPQKEVQKAARKLLFKLKTRGYKVPEIKKDLDSGPILKPVMEEKPEALLGSYDSAGTRGVMVAIPRFPKGFDVAMGVISEAQGMLEFFYGAYSKKGMKEFKQALQQSDEMTMVETSLDHAATALEKAYEANKEASNDAVKGYAEFRSLLLDKANLLGHPPIYESVPEGDIDTGLVTETNLERLFSHPLMNSFIISNEKFPDLVDEISKLDDSPIYLTAEQKSERRKEIEHKWLTENITLEERQQLKYRLEEMAYVLWGKEEQELARIALAAAKIIGEEKNIVLDYLFTKTLSLALGEPKDWEKETEEDSESLVINP